MAVFFAQALGHPAGVTRAGAAASAVAQAGAGGGAGSGRPEGPPFAWARSGPPVLASAQGTEVALWTAEGEPALPEGAAGVWGGGAVGLGGGAASRAGAGRFAGRSGARCSRLAWHPTRHLLAAGWADGTVSFWNAADCRVKEDPKTHQAELTCLEWVLPEGGATADSGDGVHTVASTGGAAGGAAGSGVQQQALLFVGDALGRVGLWRADSQARPVPVASYAFPGRRITHMCSGALGGGVPGAEGSHIFYFSGTAADGETEVYWCDARGGRGLLFRCEGTVQVLLPFAAGGQIIVLSSLCTLNVFAPPAGGAGGEWACVNSFNLAAVGADGRAVVHAAWVTDYTLAVTCDKDGSVRLYNLATEDNLTLAVPQGRSSVARTPVKLCSVAFCSATGLLAAGSKAGKIFFWQLRGGAGGEVESEQSWEEIPPLQLEGRVDNLIWATGAEAPHTLGDGAGGRGLTALAVQIEGGSTHIVARSRLVSKLRDRTVAIQIAVDRVAVQALSRGTASVVSPGMQVRGLDVSDTYLLVWGRRKVEVYDVSGASPTAVAAFPCQCRDAALCRDTIYVCRQGHLEALNFGGQVRCSVPLASSEGAPVLVDVLGDSMALITEKGYLRVFRIGGREPRGVGSGGRRLQLPGQDGAPSVPLGPVTDLAVNRKGTYVALMHEAAASGGPAANASVASWGGSHVLCYDVEHDTLLSFDFSPLGRTPQRFAWDDQEPQLLACETAAARRASGEGEARELDNGASEISPCSDGSDGLSVTTLFVASQQGRLVHHDTEAPAGHVQGLVGLVAPHLYYHRRDEPGKAGYMSDHGKAHLVKAVMRSFASVGVGDEATQRALLGFSFALAAGRPEDALKHARGAGSAPEVWEGMARMCIRTCRLEAAELCLGSLGHVRGARAARQARGLPEPDARVAAVAAHLGMVAEAERLFVRCGRHDLLNALLQAGGRWGAAVEVAEEHDRINLCATYHRHGEALETSGDFDAALVAFEKAATGSREVPRMLLEAAAAAEAQGDPKGAEKFRVKLKVYMTSRNVSSVGPPGARAKNGYNGRGSSVKGEDGVECSEKGGLDWWARFCESQGDMVAAEQCYRGMRDSLGLARIACIESSGLAQAAELAEASQDRAACLYVARRLYAEGQMQEAAHLFAAAGSHSLAARAAMRKGSMDAELLAMASRSGSRTTMAETARHLELRGQQGRAAQLYARAGHTARAVEICFQHRLFSDLQNITDTLLAGSEQNGESGGDNLTPAKRRLMQRCSSWLESNGEHARAARLLVAAGDTAAAMELCLREGVTLTEEMAESLAPSSGGDPAERKRKLAAIAQLCDQQGLHHLACKKWTQAGDKKRAMLALLRSGDTERVCFYATASRSKELYVMAANYLQTLDWHSNPDQARAIVTFYTKAGRWEGLCGFYEGCARVEAEECRDFGKCLEALAEAGRALARTSPAQCLDKEDRLARLRAHSSLVEDFVALKAAAVAGSGNVSSLEEHARALDQILDRVDRFYDTVGDPPLVRPGDVLAADFAMYASRGDFRMAVGALERMAAHGLAPANYIDRANMDEALNGAGVEPAEARRVIGGGAAPVGMGMQVGADQEEEDLPYDDVADEIVEDEIPDPYSPEPSHGAGDF